MPTETRRAVEELVHALNHGELSDILDAFTNDAVFTADGGTARGRSELADLFDPVTDEPRAVMILRRTKQDGNTLDCTATRRFTVNADGRTYAHDVEIHLVFTVRDGAVSRVEVDPLS